jgi:RNA polymerase sigma-70 factor (ECF subfamily)
MANQLESRSYAGPLRVDAKRVRHMNEKLLARAAWIERNVLPYEPDIRVWLMQHSVHNLEINDIIQEMYAKIAALDTYDHIQDSKRYAVRVAQSILIDHVRRDKNVSITPVGNIEDIAGISADPSPEDQAAAKDELRQVTAMLAKLPQRWREVLVLRRVKGLSQRETAQRLSLSEKTVEKHLARAVAVLMYHFGRGGKTHSRSSESKPVRASDDNCDIT